MLQDASPRLRAAVTLAVCAVLVLIAGLWGWNAATSPFPHKTAAAICEDTEVKAGAKVFPAEVVVNVLNASKRSGLAGRTLGELRDQGFVTGDSGDAPAKAKVPRAQIWTSTPNNPAVRLVNSWLRAKVVKRSYADIPGVVIVVGAKFDGVRGGKKSVVSPTDATVCSPPVED